MKQEKLFYIEPETSVAQVMTEGFIASSIHEVRLSIEVDEYETLDEQVIDAL